MPAGPFAAAGFPEFLPPVLGHLILLSSSETSGYRILPRPWTPGWRLIPSAAGVQIPAENRPVIPAPRLVRLRRWRSRSKYENNGPDGRSAGLSGRATPDQTGGRQNRRHRRHVPDRPVLCPASG